MNPNPVSGIHAAVARRCRDNTAHLGSFGGADRVRTDDLRLARAALSQLSYSPVLFFEASARAPASLVGLGRFELPTSRLSGVRSNQLSYRPRQGIRRVPESQVEKDVGASESTLSLWQLMSSKAPAANDL